jgi:hypothetical protein
VVIFWYAQDQLAAPLAIPDNLAMRLAIDDAKAALIGGEFDA